MVVVDSGLIVEDLCEDHGRVDSGLSRITDEWTMD